MSAGTGRQLNGTGRELTDIRDFVAAHATGFMAVGLDSDRAHAPNERVELSRLLKGAEAAGYLLDELAADLLG